MTIKMTDSPCKDIKLYDMKAIIRKNDLDYFVIGTQRHLEILKLNYELNQNPKNNRKRFRIIFVYFSYNFVELI
jgi:hypothetical protein